MNELIYVAGSDSESGSENHDNVDAWDKDEVNPDHVGEWGWNVGNSRPRSREVSTDETSSSGSE